MKKEQEIHFRVGNIYVLKRPVLLDYEVNKEVYELVEIKHVGDTLTKYKNLNGEEGELMNYEHIKLRNLWFSEDFYVEMGLKLCDENILGKLNSNYCYYNLFKSWDEKKCYEENDKYYVVSILKKDNKEMRKHFKIKKEELSNLQDLLISDSYETYSSIDDFFKILGKEGNKIDNLKSLNQESLKIQYNPIKNQPKFKWSKFPH